MKHIKRILDRLYRDYDFKGRLLHDPIEFPHRYAKPEDIEIAGFIATCFAYGRVDLFKPVVEKILFAMGNSPHGFMKDFSLRKHRRLFSGLQYRFNKNDDIVGLLYALSLVTNKHGRIEDLFRSHYGEGDPNTGKGLAGMIDFILKVNMRPVYGSDIRPYGLLQFFPSPAKGSACKRMNLFLRWMIRDRDIDFGIWKGIPKNKLVIPLDTHIARISKCLGFTERSSQDWKMAVEITEALKRFDPEDPLKYDFALCHQGISGVCSDKRCLECVLRN